MRKKTPAQKLTWLRKNHVILKKEKPTDSTIKRLYSFYHRNPLSTPRNLAYGYKGRLERKVERYGEKAIIRTPKGKISAKDYYRRQSTRTAKQIRKELSPNIVNIKFNRKFLSGKREDHFRYVFRDGKGIEINILNVKDNLNRLRRIDIPDLMENLAIFYGKRDFLYTKRTIGALIIYDTKNMPDDPVPRPVKFGLKNEFEDYLWDMLHELLVTDIFQHYKDAIVFLKHVDVFIRTREKPTPIEQLV